MTDQELLAGRPWQIEEMPDQTGRTVVVTGPTLGGLGHHTALELARRGARVVLAGRTPAKVAQTAAAIRDQVPAAVLEQLQVDLASLTSVRNAGAAAARLGAIDVLINNAGVMAPPYQRTIDGLETQLATNHFGPFLFTGLLWEQLVAAGDARVVCVASQMHRMARSAPLGDPREPTRRYRRWPVYGQSKLANLLFTSELERRCRAAGVPVKALVAHPGLAGTHLMANGRFGRSSGGPASAVDGFMKLISQPASSGAWPTLMAATADLPGNTYCGPSGPGQMTGRPKVVGRTKLARNEKAARELWEISQAATGIRYP